MADIKIRIDTDEAIRYMGYRGAPDKNQMEMISQCRELLEKKIAPAWIYRLFGLEFTEEGVHLIGTSLVLKGNDIREHLNGCKSAVLLCATASSKADELIRQKEAEDIALGFMTDCLASAAVEAVCNALENELAKRLEGKYLTWRFSPGYGDLPLEAQPEIVAVLDAGKRAGVVCTESLLLLPRKSVTAVIGVSDEPLERRRSGCAVCNMVKVCEFKRRGIHCGS